MTRFAVLSVALGFVALLAVPALAGGDGTTTAAAAPAAGLATTACKPAGRGVWIGKRFATVHCGPATATVKLGGRTLTFSKGTCVWTTNSFTLQLGTIFLWLKPYPVNPALSIWTSGGPVARALVHIYWQGTRTILTTTRTTARANATRTGGTFDGRTAAGARVTGTVKCR